MNIEWRKLELPNFGVTEIAPEIPREIYEDRCRKFYSIAESEWVVVYGDREHFANLHYLTEFDPRFEEAVLVLGPNDQKYLLVGNEGLMYQSVVKPKLNVIHCQSFSLMGQDRSQSPRLDEILIDFGISKGDKVGVCGWKYFEPEEMANYHSFFVPAALLDCLRNIVGDAEGIVDVSSLLMHPTKGLRAYNELEQIAAFEWGAARASLALSRIVKGTRPGISELEAVSNMGYAGEPLTTHVMYASSQREIVGLRSPSGRKIEEGDGVFTAFGYRGGLSARGGLVEKDNKEFLDKWAIPYYRGIAAWYESVSVGVDGGDIYNHISEELAIGGLRPALNPGHLTSSDEWLHSSFRPNSNELIASGMAIQCDIIPAPMSDGIVLNCEDSVFLADKQLRNDLSEKYPEMWKRIEMRQKFMRNELGINISEDILPFSSTPGYYTPLFLSNNYALTIK